MALRPLVSQVVRPLGVKPAPPHPALTNLLQSVPAFFPRRFAAAAIPLQLVIKAHAGDKEVKTITLDVKNTDTVDSVKQKIQEAEGYPANQQFLVLGLRLEGSQTLADYDIQKDTVLHMRMKPGQPSA